MSIKNAYDQLNNTITIVSGLKIVNPVRYMIYVLTWTLVELLVMNYREQIITLLK